MIEIWLNSDSYLNKIINLMNINDLIARWLTIEDNNIKERYAVTPQRSNYSASSLRFANVHVCQDAPIRIYEYLYILSVLIRDKNMRGSFLLLTFNETLSACNIKEYNSTRN